MMTRAWLGRTGAVDVLALTSAIWFLAKFVRYAFPPLFETFQRAYGASPATLGLLFSGLMVVYAGMQFPSGALADRVGTVRVITAGVTLVGVAALGLAATQAFPALVFAMVLIGAGTGVHKTVAINLLADASPGRVGRTMGTMDAVGELGGVAAPAAVLLALSTAAGWPALFGAVGLGGLALAVAFARRVQPQAPDRPRSGAEATGSIGLRGYLSVLRDPHVAGFVVVIMAYAFAFNGLVAFLPLFLTTAAGVSSTAAGVLYASLFAVSLVQPVTGALSDRIGRYRLMVATLGTAALALGGLLLALPVGVIAALVVLVGVGGHGFRPVREAHLMDVLPAAAGGGSLGLVRTVMMGVGAVAPAVVGAIAATASYRRAFLVLAGAFGFGAVVVALLATVDR